jgi:hypothetical protein
MNWAVQNPIHSSRLLCGRVKRDHLRQEMLLTCRQDRELGLEDDGRNPGRVGHGIATERGAVDTPQDEDELLTCDEKLFDRSEQVPEPEQSIDNCRILVPGGRRWMDRVHGFLLPYSGATVGPRHR